MLHLYSRNHFSYFVFRKGVLDGYDDGMADRFKDASAGSFSYNKGHRFYAKKYIMAGDEIFAGENNYLYLIKLC